MIHRFAQALLAITLAGLIGPIAALAADGNRLTYLDDVNPWHPHRDFPKLTTPQWVGEKGVDCVVILAIDDMRDTAKYERYLRPILNRLKKIDGRAPVSIMTCNVKPNDPRLQTWLDEGLSIECHTVDHPCPLLHGGDFKKAKSTYDRCIDLMNRIPRSKPVAFRTPCCDSLNTVSPRFYAEIFNRTTPKGNFLQIDSSVFNFFTSADKSIPRHLVLEPASRERQRPEQRERFLKYLPRGLKRGGHTHNHFVNYIENYPYPYVIGNTCWQFPCVAPSDWSAQHLHGKNNPKTVADWKAALDITVKKQGVFCLVFHPHGWIKAEQIVELIDHAVKTHGKKVKFLNFREAAERLKKNLQRGNALGPYGFDSGIRFMDVNDDGFMDVVQGGLIGFDNNYIGAKPVCRIWSSKSSAWRDTAFPVPLSMNLAHNLAPVGARFGILNKPRHASLLISHRSGTNKNRNKWTGFWNYEKEGWEQRLGMLKGLTRGESIVLPEEGEGIRLRDLDRDGICELVVGRPAYKFFGEHRAIFGVYRFNQKLSSWKELPFRVPLGTSISAGKKRAAPGYPDAGLRFVDLNADGRDDIVFSNHERYGVWLFKDMKSGWSVEVLNAKRSPGFRKSRGSVVLPPIVRKDGTNNGFFTHGRHLCWQNEQTDKLPDLIYRVSFQDLLKKAAAKKPTPKKVGRAFQPDANGRNTLKARRATGQAFQPDANGRRTLKTQEKPGQAGKPDLRKPRPLSPQMSLKAMQPRPGFQVELVAAEPLVRDPVAFEWGPEGKLWVAEMADYPVGTNDNQSPRAAPQSPRAAPRGTGGRVRFLEDTDDDGRYDKSTLFLDGLNFPTGVLPWKKGVLITAAPDILYAEDTDGDGKADVKTVLFTGFGQGNQQHRVNGLVRGLDNWIYCANGDSDGRITSTKPAGRAPRDIRGRDFRFNPETGELQTLTGRTQFGRSRDDWGNWFGCNNSNPHYHFVLAERYLARNPHVRYPDPRNHVSVQPGAAPVYPVSKPLPRFNDYNKLNRFTSACGAMIYRDTLFGPEFAGNSFVSEPVHNLVHREIVKPSGVTFSSRRAKDERQSEFLASRDNWFRPTTIKTGPDGALYIADMYRLVIEHPQYIPKELQSDWDFRAGENRGRIYRVFPKGKKLRRIPRLDTMTTAQLVAALSDSNGWVRDTAQQLLIVRNDKSAVPLLERIVGERRGVSPPVKRENALARLHALCTLDGLDALKPSVIATALTDPHPGVRRHAVRLAERHLNTSPKLAAEVAKLVDDSDPQVRMQLAYSLGEWKDPQSGELLAKLLQNGGDDRYLTAAALSSVHAKNLDTLVTVMLRNVSASGRRKPADSTNAAWSQVLSLAASLGGEKALRTILKQITTPLNPAKPAKQWTFDVAQLTALTAFLEGLQSRRMTVRGLIASANPKEAALLETQMNRLDLFALKTAFARGGKTKTPDRVVAIRYLPHGAGFENSVAGTVRSARELLIPQEDARVQSAAVAALSRMNHDNVPQTLLKDWASHTPSLRSEIVDALLSRRSWTRELLSAIKTGKVEATDISAVHRQRLLSLRNRELRKLAADVLKSVRAESDRAKVVARLQSSLKLDGDVSRGKAVFKKTCAACHRLEDVGKNVGPDLTALKDNSPPALLAAILDPNRNVESKYVNYVAVTNSGRTFTGLLANEAGGSITLVGPEGKQHVLLRRDLERLRSTSKSAMPEGLEKDLQRQAVADVIAYVRSIGSAGRRVRPNGRFPRTIRAGKDGAFTLAADNCEIYGPSLKLEAKHNNLGWWGSAKDRAVWPIYVPANRTYSVEIEFACAKSTAGNTLRLECGSAELSAEVPSTGTWDNYMTKTIGRLKLPAGQQRLTIRAANTLQGYLIDLKSVRLTPVR